MTHSHLLPRPSLAPSTPWRFPAFEDAPLRDLTLSTTHLPGRPLITATLTLPFPTLTDPAGKEGLTLLTAYLLDEGTRLRSAESFAEDLALLSATWSVHANDAALFVSVDAPASTLSPALSLLAESVFAPLLAERDFERVKASLLDSLVSSATDPSHRAWTTHLQSIWAPTSRASLPSEGSLASLSALTYEDVLDRASLFAPGGRLVVAGDLSGLDLPSLVDSTFAPYARPSSTLPLSPDAPLDAPSLLVVNRPGAVQTQLCLGLVTPSRTSPLWAPLQLASYALAGTLTSRVDAVLREEKGYTYGMHSSLSPRSSLASWSLAGSVDTPSTLPAVSDLLSILDSAPGTLTATEVSSASAYLAGVSALRWETPSAVASQAATLYAAGLTPAWLDTYLQGLSSASLSDVEEALTLLPRSAMSLVAVGDADHIADGLAAQTGLPLTVLSE